MAKVINRTTKIIKNSVNTPDFSTEDWIINPDLSAVVNVPTKYVKIARDVVSEMTQGEKDTVDTGINETRNYSNEDKKFHIQIPASGNVTSTTWYKTDNGDATYSDKIEETLFTYVNDVVSTETINIYSIGGTVLEAKVWNYSIEGTDIVKKLQ